MNKTNHGFISISYPLNSRLLDNNSLLNAITKFFKGLKKDETYFLLLRLKSDNSIVTLHKGVVLNKTNLKAYFHHCTDTLAFKSNDYTDTVYNSIIFDYFIIDKDRVKNYTSKWQEIVNSEPIKLAKFSINKITLHLPLNRNYASWGGYIGDYTGFKNSTRHYDIRLISYIILVY